VDKRTISCAGESNAYEFRIVAYNTTMEKEIALMLHNVRSMHNVGSIFRTADAAGVKKIYLTGVTPTPLDRFGKIRTQFGKVSLGAENTVAWDASARSTREVKKLFERLKADRYKIFAVEQSKKSIPYHSLKPQTHHLTPIVLVLGNEVAGLPRSILKHADAILEIPMLGDKESLNVAVTAGIVLFRMRYES